MELIITDLTKFGPSNPNKLCTAGICLSTGILVRPLPYLDRDQVLNEGIRPGSVLSGVFSIKPDQVLPHVEDYFAKDLKNNGDAGEGVFFDILKNSIKGSVASGFNLTNIGKKIPKDTPPPFQLLQ